MLEIWGAINGFASPPYAKSTKQPISKCLHSGKLLMNAEIEMKTDEVLRVKLAVLQQEHRDLDEAIDALHQKTTADQLMIQRLKRQKLGLKDHIARIEDLLTPDIIA